MGQTGCNLEAGGSIPPTGTYCGVAAFPMIGLEMPE